MVRLRDGRWAALEVKLGNKQIEEAAQNLLVLKAKINEDKMEQASFLMVITGGQYAYRRNDGVLVVPIGCLHHSFIHISAHQPVVFVRHCTIVSLRPA